MLKWGYLKKGILFIFLFYNHPSINIAFISEEREEIYMTKIEMEFYEVVIKYLPRIAKGLETIAKSKTDEDAEN